METYLHFVDRWSKWILAVLALVTVFFAIQLGSLTNDSNPYLLSESHPARKSILDMQKEFTGTFDSAMVVVYHPDSVFNRVTLDAVYELTKSARRLMLANADDAAYLAGLKQRYGAASPAFGAAIDAILAGGLEQNDYFEADKLQELAKPLGLSQADSAFLSYLPRRLNPIKEMAGLAATDNILNQDGTLVITKSLHDKTTPPEQIRAEVMGNEMLLNSVVSRDEKVTMITVELFIKQDDADGQVRAYDAIRKQLDDYRKAHPEFKDQVYIAGMPIFIAEQKKLTDSDLETLLPLVIAVVGGILIAYFRKPLGFLLPMLNVITCTIWTLGAMSLMRVPMDLVTNVLPVFLITICGADAIHMMSEYYTQKGTGISSKDAVRRTLRAMVSPIVLTTATTVAGFLFSTSTNISSIQSFGIFMAVGLVSAQIISLLLIPAWINLMGGKRIATAATGQAEAGWLGRALASVFSLLIRNRKPALLVFAVLMAGAAVMATRISVEDAGASYFRPDNEFRKSDEFINTHIAGTSPGWIRIEGDGPNAMLTTETMDFIGRLDAFLLTQPKVTYTYSPATYVKRMHLTLNDMKPAYNRLPQKTETVNSTDAATGKQVSEQVDGNLLVSQLVMLYENGGGNDLTNVLTRDFSKGAVLFTMNTTRATEYQHLLDSLDQWLAVNKPAHLKVSVAGTPVVWSGVLNEIIKGQLTSFILAFSSICVVLMLWMRSARLGMLTALPLAATMVVYYGVMAALGIELNIGTALISFIVVGIVDYSVHYLHRVQVQLEAGDRMDDALIFAIRHSGESIAFNVAVFSLGFLTLLFSEFKPIAYLGGLVALALVISGFMSLFLISMLAPVFMKERPATPGKSGLRLAV
ncbi:MAG: efflux RND transporter permease subunit [Pseudomonadota bacterium]